MTDLIVRDTEIVGWQAEEELTFEEWCEVGTGLLNTHRTLQWALGDWLNYGADRSEVYGEKYAEAVDEFKLAYQTVADYAWVAREFDPSLRRENLSWSHHKIVAGLESEDRTRWLDNAESEGDGANAMQGKIRKWQADLGLIEHKNPKITLVIDGPPEQAQEQAQHIARYAEQQGIRVLNFSPKPEKEAA